MLLVGEGERLAVVAGDQVGDHRLAPVAVERLGELEDVALRLRHLLLVGLDHPVVHPDPGERDAPGRLGLGDLVLVVGEDEVEPPPWIAKSAPSSFSAIAEHSMCQPGRPGPQGESQRGVLALLVRLPEREVERVLLERCRPGLLALVHLVRVAVGELAVAVEAAHPEVDVAAALVGVAALDQGLDQGDDLRDRLRGERLGVGTAEAEPRRCPRRRRGSSRFANSAEGSPASLAAS